VSTIEPEHYVIVYYPWLYYGYIEIPDMKGHKPTRIEAAIKDGMNGVKIHYLKLE
jgi:hypothetical protein